MAKQLVTREGFTKWLKGKKPTAIVGFANNVCDCPLATYVGSVLGPVPSNYNREISVDDRIYVELRATDSYHRRTQPFTKWMNTFINKIDLGATTVTGKVTAKKALKVLSIIP